MENEAENEAPTDLHYERYLSAPNEAFEAFEAPLRILATNSVLRERRAARRMRLLKCPALPNFLSAVAA
jgi:hypothetical protein